MYKPPGQPLGLCGLRICISNKLRGDTDAKPRLRWLVLNFMVLEKLCGLPVNAQTQPPPRRNPDHVNQNSGSGTPAVAQPRLRIRAPRTVQGCWLTGKQSRCSHPAAVPSLTASGPLKLHCCCRESTESHVLTLTHPALGCARAWTLLDSWKEPSCFSPPPDFPSYFSLQLGESCQPLQV